MSKNRHLSLNLSYFPRSRCVIFLVTTSVSYGDDVISHPHEEYGNLDLKYGLKIQVRHPDEGQEMRHEDGTAKVFTYLKEMSKWTPEPSTAHTIPYITAYLKVPGILLTLLDP